MKELQIEWMKMKRRSVWLVLLALWGVQSLYLFWGNMNLEEAKQGWLMILYQLPLLNGVMIPTVMAVMASRLIDTEHKGNMWKFLETVQQKNNIYRNKALCGFLFVFGFCILQMLSALAAGIYKGYEGAPEFQAYGLYFTETFFISLALYLLQMMLSVIFQNQMIALAIGLCGSIAGLFLMFMPQWRMLRCLIIWGNYGATMFVGGDWNRETRISTFYYMDIDKIAVCLSVLWIFIFYFVGKRLFTRMEV